jgi:two-component system LytT family response regulator
MSEPTIKAVIIDDEPAARRGIALLLQSHPEIEVVGEAGSRSEALALIQREAPDLAFLDVQMPGGDGFSVLEALEPEQRPVVIFATAFDSHALKAFEVSAVDYLLKPYEDARFHAAVERAARAIRGRADKAALPEVTRLLEFLGRLPVAQQPAAPEGRIQVKSGGEIIFLRPDEIDWIEAEGDYMKFHTGGKSLLMRETMARLEARLDGRRFVRIHRSVIVNIDRIRKLSPSFAGDHTVVLRDGTSLRLSRSYHDRLTELLRQSQ